MDSERLLGRIERRERPNESGQRRDGPLGKLIGGLLSAFQQDWCIDLEDREGIADHRALLAAMILLMEQTIANDQAT